ncbi:manganese transporter [Roseovarius atlanticus]|uniref:Manganese transporter n=1 Tax=Roseovarius atlanticus TaxID=1641875 RepID=A0A0T5NYF7_9RHOB|nr:zinc ABC transporter substrate-binding protein [Roseovarius atlanticus]KRS13846.1 manganese transporter [Roseovarius atlanticus]
MHLSRRQIVLGALVAGTFAGTPLRAQSGRLSVVATTGMIGDAALRVGGDHVEVRSLMGAGVDPHSYRQTRTDIQAALRADIVLWHGLYLEAQMEEFLLKLGQRGTAVPVGENVPRQERIAHEDYVDKFDPHVWMVPQLWAYVVNGVRDALSAAAPERAQDFAANAAAYQAELTRLGEYAKTTLATVPPSARVLLSAHDAFGYFGAAFDFDVIGIQGISTESEAGLSRIRTLVDMLVERDVQAVFVETSVSDRNVRALVEGAAARGHAVRIGGELFSDAMGEPGSYEGTYIGMIDHNVTTIADALGGRAPERGMQGRLAAAS